MFANKRSQITDDRDKKLVQKIRETYPCLLLSVLAVFSKYTNLDYNFSGELS